MLLVEPGRAVSVDRMITEVWGDEADPGAAASLYTQVSNLRRLLGKDRIVRDASGYRLSLLDGDEFDASAFDTDVARYRRVAESDPAGAVKRFDGALRRWRGRPFEGLEDVPELTAEIVRLDELRADVEMDRFDAMLRAGGIPPVGDVEALCRRRKMDERPWALLMRTQYRAGRHAEALRSYAEVRRLFGAEMGIGPSPSLKRLEEQILLHDPALDPTPQVTPTNLPGYLTSFVGRVAEQRLVGEAVRDHRLVTVMGPGGVGKTRLATEVASSLTARFPDGVWLVDLAQVGEGMPVGPAVAAGVGVPAASTDEGVDGVVAAIRTGTVLIVLDNCEHVRAPVARAAESLLADVPGLTILATSRRALDVPGEVRFTLDGLGVGSPDTSEAGRGDAESLFIERSAQIEPRLGQDEKASSAITAICEHLDGMPLALELAAARSDVLSPAEIADLLTHRFAVLVDDRQRRDLHRSLEATVGWSYGLLDPSERKAFATLGVFEGPFTASAAAAVLGFENHREAIMMIERLVAASLVKVDSREERATTYRLLETLRGYARDRLEESGGRSDAIRGHDDYYLGVCDGLWREFYGAGRVDATRQIALELAEYLAVWDRNAAVDPPSVLPLAWPLGNYWLFGGGLGEGEKRLTRLLEETTADGSLARADALTVTGWIMAYRNRWDQSMAWTSEAIAAYRASGEDMRLAYALARGGHWAFGVGKGEAATGMLHESLEICDRIGYEDGKAWPTVLIAQARRWSGDTDPEIRDLFLEARRRFIEMGESYGQIHADMILVTFREFSIEERLRFANEMVELAQRHGGESLMRPIAFHNLAYPTWQVGERERAQGLNRLAIRSAMATGATIDLGLGLIQAATFAAERGNAEQAAMMFGAGSTHFGMDMAPFQQEDLAPAVELAQKAIGDTRYEELYRIGSAMSAEEAAEYALASPKPDS
jgi:predicted ATPase